MDEARANGGLYRRLIERIACALGGAEAVRWRGGQEPGVLELHDLSPAERALIRAYLRQDVQWLRGWQAAAEELALIERQEHVARAFAATGSLAVPRRIRPLRHARLFCALCGRAVRQRRAGSIAACPACASRLFRVGQRRRPC
ncbi:zinc ribbon-containing protein [Azotobacter armeniacus]